SFPSGPGSWIVTGTLYASSGRFLLIVARTCRRPFHTNPVRTPKLAATSRSAYTVVCRVNVFWRLGSTVVARLPPSTDSSRLSSPASHTPFPLVSVHAYCLYQPAGFGFSFAPKSAPG